MPEVEWPPPAPDPREELSEPWASHHRRRHDDDDDDPRIRFWRRWADEHGWRIGQEDDGDPD